MSQIIFTDRNALSTNLFFSDVKKHDVLTKDEEQKLFVEYHSENVTNQRKNIIKEKILLSNLRWCVTLAKKAYCNGIEQQDLISTAYVGMLECFDSYDHTKGMKFATYASYHMQNALNLFIYGDGKTLTDKSSSKVIDIHIKKVTKILTVSLQREPTSSEIIEKFNETKKDNVATLTEEFLHSRYLQQVSPAGIEETFGDDENGDILSKTDFGSTFADEEVITNEKNVQIRKMLSNILSERETTIIMYNFGLVDGIEHTLDMISSKIGLTRERVGQLQATALKKLQANKKTFAQIL